MTYENTQLSVTEYRDTLGHLMFTRLEGAPAGSVPLAVGISNDLPLDVAQEIASRWNAAVGSQEQLLGFVRSVALHQGSDYAQWARDLLAKLGVSA